MRLRAQRLVQLGIAATVLAVPVLLAPPASASVTFGSDLSEGVDPNPTFCSGTCSSPIDTFADLLVKPGNAFPAASPMDGVVVKFGISSSNFQALTFRLVSASGSPVSGSGAGTGPTVTVPAGVTSVAARLPVKAGQFAGFDASNATGSYSFPVFPGPGCFQGVTDPPAGAVWNPSLANGETPRESSVGFRCEVLVNATVEPDADHDGFGDETQDRCGTDASTQGTCPVRHKKCKKKHHRSAELAKKKKCKKRKR